MNTLIKDPVDIKCLDISTAHITATDSKLLEQACEEDNPSLSVYDYSYQLRS